MSTLQEQLDRLIARKGESSPMVQMLRNQIIAERSGASFRQLYEAGAPMASQLGGGHSGFKRLQGGQGLPRGVQVGEDLLDAYEDVRLCLNGKRKAKRFHDAVSALSDYVEDDLLGDVGERLGDGLPLGYLQTYLNDGEMASQLGISEEACSRVTNAERAKFARDRLLPMQSSTDADLCPGFWSLRVTDGQSHFFLGFSVAGYSFSGVEWTQQGAFLNEADFVAHVCCETKMLFENRLCFKGMPTPIDQLADAALLRLVWGH
jgi:hypothetical protein